MPQINLQDFDTYKPYLLDTDGDLSSMPKQSDKGHTPGPPQGFYSIRKLGLRPPRVKDFVAVFLDGESLWMIIQGKKYNLSDSDIATKRKRLFLGVREFFLMKGEQVLVSCVYWNTCGTSAEGSEIFEYAERVTNDASSKTDFLNIWNAIRSGKDLNDLNVLMELERAKKQTPYSSTP